MVKSPGDLERGNGQIQPSRWKFWFLPSQSWLLMASPEKRQPGNKWRKSPNFAFFLFQELQWIYFINTSDSWLRGWRLQDDFYIRFCCSSHFLFRPSFALWQAPLSEHPRPTPRSFSPHRKKGGGDLTKWFPKQTAGDDVWSKGCLVAHVFLVTIVSKLG